jgi:hypothetical protein
MMVRAATRTLLHALLMTDVELDKYRSPQAKVMNQYANSLSKEESHTLLMKIVSSEIFLKKKSKFHDCLRLNLGHNQGYGIDK